MTNVFISIRDGEKLDNLLAEQGLQKWNVEAVDASTWSGGPILGRLPESGLLVTGKLETPWHEEFCGLQILAV